MSPREDLERRIRESYSVIQQCENKRRLTEGVLERGRLEQTIQEQRGLIQECLTDYHRLVDRSEFPDDIQEIAAILGPEASGVFIDSIALCIILKNTNINSILFPVIIEWPSLILIKNFMFFLFACDSQKLTANSIMLEISNRSILES